MKRLPLVAAGLAAALSVALSGSAATTVLGSGRPAPTAQLLALSHTEAAAASERAFAQDLVAVLAAEHSGNLVVSPASIFDALSLLAPGARGQTYAQLTRALHAAGSSPQLIADLVGLEQHLGTADGTVAMASAAWLQQSYQIVSAYRQLLTDAGAAPQALDFRADPDGARQIINQWVLGHTGNRIDDLFAPGTISDSTRLVLANAVALTAQWVTPFPQRDTQEAPFTTPGGPRSVPTMNLVTSMDYVQTADAQAVRLPYATGGLDALVVLPTDTAADPLTLLGTLPGISVQLSPHTVQLAMPRFAAETSTDLKSSLGALGLAELFRFPDLSGIAGAPGDLHVDSAVHKAWISVDEAGTKASAATGISVATNAALIRQPIRMTVDRPFLFVVEDTATGVPLFVARITEPHQEGS